MAELTYREIRQSEEVNTYIRRADASMAALGYTEHSFAHVSKVAKVASELLRDLDYPARTVELTQIAGYMHDIGNVINRVDHAQSGAMMAFRILNNMGMPPEEIALIITAIGNHDEGTAFPVNEVAAALILADKTDVRRSRVRNQDISTFDIHDRVNYSAVDSHTVLDREKGELTNFLTIDTELCSVMDYFEIFMQRMLLCRKAADYFNLRFRMNVNGQTVL